METLHTIITYEGKDYPVDYQITYEGVDAHVKVRVAGKAFKLVPEEDGLKSIPADTGLDQGLVTLIAWEVLKGL